jgi:hypothetical protein
MMWSSFYLEMKSITGMHSEVRKVELEPYDENVSFIIRNLNLMHGGCVAGSM